MDINAGLMALANFGTGYQRGQRQYVADQMQKLDLQNAQLQEQKNQRNLDFEQKESDHMMRSFLPQIAGIPGPGGSGGKPQQPSHDQQGGVAPGQGPAFGTPEWFMKQGEFAASIGDMGHATQMATNAQNATLAQYSQVQKAGAIQEAELKRQAQSYANVSRILGDPSINASGNPEQEFQRRLLAVLSDPNVSPEEKKNLQGMKYSPQLVDQIGQSGMTAAQRATNQLGQLRLQQTQRHDQAMESLSRQRLLSDQAYHAAQLSDKQKAEKVGKGGQAVTSAEISQATPVIKQIMGDSYKENDPSSRIAVDTIASRAKQMVNRPGSNLNFSQAIAIAAKQADSSGEFKKTTIPGHHINIGGFEIVSKDKTKVDFAQQDGSQQSPIPLDGLSKADLVPGKWYVKDGQVQQYNP